MYLRGIILAFAAALNIGTAIAIPMHGKALFARDIDTSTCIHVCGGEDPVECILPNYLWYHGPDDREDCYHCCPQDVVKGLPP
ncbi:hypothetical protein FQN54_002975 [Arachnomyces sp. PD_36]|nr:hypothetical protein FQN54_002975 [Arachnomyces sp. PD_36]